MNKLDMSERTLILLKPEAVERGIAGEIISRFERLGLKIVGLKMVKPTEDLVRRHYPYTPEWAHATGTKAINALKKHGVEVTKTPEEIGKEINMKLVNYFLKHPTPVIALVLEGHKVIAKVRRLAGATNPHAAEPGTIRGDFSHDSFELGDLMNRPVNSVIHASDSKENAEKEIKIWFKDSEIFEYSNLHDKLSLFWTRLE